MKPVFFVGPVKDYSNPLIEHLKKLGYMILKTDNVDEIDQSGQQFGKSILIFNDLAFAHKFLSENSWMANFEEMYALYLDKEYNIPKETMDKIETARIKLYYAQKGKLLIDDIGKFIESGSADLEEIDIEFNVHTKQD